MKKCLSCLLLCTLVAGMGIHAREINVLPDSPDDFLCCRVSIEKCSEGYTGFMSTNRWAELVWVPPEEKYSEFSVEIKALNIIPDCFNTWALKLIDAEGEIYDIPGARRTQVKHTLNGMVLHYPMDMFKRSNGPKGDGAITFPLKRIYLLHIVQTPPLPGQAIGFLLKSCKGTVMEK